MTRLVCLLGLLASFFVSGCNESSETSESRSAPKPVPSASGVSIRPADSFDLSAYRGKVLMINFWATWCVYCRKETPHLIELYDRYRDRDFELVGVALERSGGEKAVRSFAEKQGVPYPLFVDAKQQIVRQFGGVRGLPTTLIIDRHGKTYKRYPGFQGKGAFERDIESLLE